MDRGVATVIIDAYVLIREKRPKNSHGSFEGYAMFLKDLIEDEIIYKFDRVDMVFDRYFEFSTKSVTRTKRSGDQGTRYHVLGNTSLPGNWTTFLKRVENKRELNEFLLFLQNALLKQFKSAQGKYLLRLAMKTYWWYPIGVIMWTLCSLVTSKKLIHI